LTWAAARAGALLEAAELWAAELPDPSALLFGSAEALGERCWPLAEQVVAPRLAAPGARLAWVRAAILGAPGEVLVPAAAIYCPPADGPLLGPAAHRWTSNGMGAFPTEGPATLHALLEAAERDGLARALPEGWTEREVARRKLGPAALPAVPRAAALADRLSAQGLRAHLFDLRPLGRWLDLPLAGALLVDEEGGPLQLTAGYACGLDPDAALLGALLEAAQSRLTDVHGAREDVSAPDRVGLQALALACARSRGRRRGLAPGPGARAGLPAVLRVLAQAGFPRAAAVRLTPAEAPVAVVKVIVPGFLLSELL
jgi:YcaO-like protein with predicted kinase domain